MTQHNNDLWLFKENSQSRIPPVPTGSSPHETTPRRLAWRHLLTFMHDSAPLDNHLRESVFPLQATLCLFARNGKDPSSQL